MRWTDWFLAALIGALSWGAVSISQHMTLIEQRARSQDTYYVVAYTHLVLVAVILIALAVAAYVFLLRPAKGHWIRAGTVSLGITLVGAILLVWSIFFLIRSGAPLGYDVYPDAYAFWYTVASIGIASVCLGGVAFAAVSVTALVQRLRR